MMNINDDSHRPYLGRDARKTVFGVSDKARLKPVSSAEISLAASLGMILSKKRITKVLVRLRECAGWSAPLLFENLQRLVFSCLGPFVKAIYRKT